MKINRCKMCKGDDGKGGRGKVASKRRGPLKVYRVVCCSCENFGAQVESEQLAIRLWNEQRDLFDEPAGHSDFATGCS